MTPFNGMIKLEVKNMVNNLMETSDDEIRNFEKTYSTSEVAEFMDVGLTTVRKYSQTLESQGYGFLRSQASGRHKARLYRKTDIEALNYLKTIREEDNTTVEQAATIVIEVMGLGANEGSKEGATGYDIATIDNNQLGQTNPGYEKLIEQIKKQDEMITQLNQRLNELEEGISERDQLIVGTLKDISQSVRSMEELKAPETPKQLEAPKTRRVRKKQGFLAWLFSR